MQARIEKACSVVLSNLAELGNSGMRCSRRKMSVAALEVYACMYGKIVGLVLINTGLFSAQPRVRRLGPQSAGIRWQHEESP